MSDIFPKTHSSVISIIPSNAFGCICSSLRLSFSDLKINHINSLPCSLVIVIAKLTKYSQFGYLGAKESGVIDIAYVIVGQNSIKIRIAKRLLKFCLV